MSEQDLDPSVRRGLRTLRGETADRVGAHLAAAQAAFVDDPELAFRHAAAAKRWGARVGVVREAYGVAAYRAGHFAVALAELRAARRLTGDVAYLAVMADCERGLGRPERALELSRSPEAARLDLATRTEMALVASGARRDLGQPDAAVQVLEPVRRAAGAADPSTPRVLYAYAEALLAAGQVEPAREWFASAAALDPAGLTDADDRAHALGGPGDDAGAAGAAGDAGGGGEADGAGEADMAGGVADRSGGDADGARVGLAVDGGADADPGPGSAWAGPGSAGAERPVGDGAGGGG